MVAAAWTDWTIKQASSCLCSGQPLGGCTEDKKLPDQCHLTDRV